MGESFLIKRVGGGGVAFATISVKYPSGSSCICTDGTKIIKAKGTTGICEFFVPRAGAWTISCTDGTKTASETVIVSAKGSSFIVYLYYEVFLYNNGTQVVPFGGTAETNSSYAFQADRIYTWSNTSKNYSTVGIYTADKVDLSPYNTLTFLVDYFSQTSGNQAFGMGVATNKSNYPTYAKKVNPSKQAGVIQTITIDLSDVSGSYYVAYNGAASTYVYEIYLL